MIGAIAKRKAYAPGMRSALFVLSISLVLPACARNPSETNETGTEGTEGGDAAEASTNADSDEESGTADSTTNVDEGEESAEWTGGDGDGGDGGDGDSGDGDSADTGDGDSADTGDGDTADTADTADTSNDNTTGSDCSMTITQEIDADEATLTGDWVLGSSQLAPEEGNIVFPETGGGGGGGGPAQGSATFALDFPCDDDWYVWVKGLDRGSDDSFFVRVDGEPSEGAIFDLDCEFGNEQGSYIWELLNERIDPQGCGEDNPWVISADGSVDLEFEEREPSAISAIAFSNDPGYTPNF